MYLDDVSNYKPVLPHGETVSKGWYASSTGSVTCRCAVAAWQSRSWGWAHLWPFIHFRLEIDLTRLSFHKDCSCACWLLVLLWLNTWQEATYGRKDWSWLTVWEDTVRPSCTEAMAVGMNARQCVTLSLLSESGEREGNAGIQLLSPFPSFIPSRPPAHEVVASIFCIKSST